MLMDLKDKREEQKVDKNKHFLMSLEFALQGVKTVFDEERNMKKHVALGIIALIMGFIFQLDRMEWLWLLLSVFLVWIVEIMNTVFENVVDMFTDFHFHPIGKKIKDMADWGSVNDCLLCCNRWDHLIWSKNLSTVFLIKRRVIMSEHKSGFVAIVGRPNVGKSTLLNRIVGQKIAIMSDKAQTTRNKIQGVYTTPEAQLIFIDTPGIHKPKHRLGDFMVETAYSALREVDALLFMISADQKRGKGDDFIIERLKNVQSPVYLVINKIDKVHPDELLGIIEDYSSQMEFAQVVPISATEGNNVERLMEVLVDEMPEGPQYFPDDQVTDHPEYFIVSELIREKVLFLTRDEVPHSVAVVIDTMKRNENNKIHIQATIIVERDSQKGIIIGKGGKMLKDIGTKARRDIENLLGDKVFLELWVKVQKDWRDKRVYLQDFGYRQDEY